MCHACIRIDHSVANSLAETFLSPFFLHFMHATILLTSTPCQIVRKNYKSTMHLLVDGRALRCVSLGYIGDRREKFIPNPKEKRTLNRNKNKRCGRRVPFHDNHWQFAISLHVNRNAFAVTNGCEGSRFECIAHKNPNRGEKSRHSLISVFICIARVQYQLNFSQLNRR